MSVRARDVVESMAARVRGFGGVAAIASAMLVGATMLAATLTGCAVHPAPLAATSAANPSSERGRLAGAPATLRPGVVDYALPTASESKPAPEHHHHHAP